MFLKLVIVQEVVEDSYETKTPYLFREHYKGEESGLMLNPSRGMLDSQANDGRIFLAHTMKITSETSSKSGIDLCTSNIGGYSVLPVHATRVKVEPSDYIQDIRSNEVDGIPPAAVEGPGLLHGLEIDVLDHVTLQERYEHMLSSMNHALGYQYNLEFSQGTMGFTSLNGLHGKDPEVIPKKEGQEGAK